MPNKLISLKIDHIAGVDRPANKRRFIITKSEKEIEKAMTVKPEGGKFCVYNGDQKVGTYDTRAEAMAALKKSDSLVKGVYISASRSASIREEGDKFTVYSGEDGRVLGEYDSMDKAIAGATDYINKSEVKGAIMLSKEQIGKITDKELVEAIVQQQEEMLASEKKVKALEEQVAKGGGSPTDKEDEQIWKGVPVAVRSRFESIVKERDDMEKTAKKEKDEREIEIWKRKVGDFQFLGIIPEHFGKVMKAVAEEHELEADEIMRVLTMAETLIGKGAIFQEIGKGRNGNQNRFDGDATNIVARVQNLASDYMVQDKTLKESDAITKVFKEKPEWYPLYARQVQVGVQASNG